MIHSHYINTTLLELLSELEGRSDIIAAGARQSTDESTAGKRAQELIDAYAKRYPKAARCLEEGLDDALTYYAFPQIYRKKIYTSNMSERINRKIRRRSKPINVFPGERSYIKLITTHLIEQTEDRAGGHAYISPEIINLLLEGECYEE